MILFMTPVVSLFTLSTLFAEPRVGKVQAKRLEGDLRRHRNCRYIYYLLADTVAISVDTLFLYSCGQPNGHSHEAAVIATPL